MYRVTPFVQLFDNNPDHKYFNSWEEACDYMDNEPLNNWTIKFIGEVDESS